MSIDQTNETVTSTRPGAPGVVTEPPHANGKGPRRTRKRSKAPGWVWPVVLIAAVAVGWWIWSRVHANPDANSNMILTTVTRGNLVETVSATGSVEAQTGAQIAIGSQITGVIKRLHADVGSHVTAGQVIAELDLPDLQDQLVESQAALATAQTKLLQTENGVKMTNTQVQEALDQAKAGVASAQANLVAGQATARQQLAQTPTDIRKAVTALASAKAALATAQATLLQTQQGAKLQVATATEQQTQAAANAKNAALDLKRQQTLLASGYVAQSTVDQAQATATVDQSLVGAAEENVSLTQQKVAADLETSKDAVAQAAENVQSADAALAAARSEVYTNQAKLAGVQQNEAAVLQSQQAAQVAAGNMAQIVQYQQNVQEAREAVQQAQATYAYNQVQVAKSYIRTPITGTVTQLAEQQGETIAAGLSAPTLIIVTDLNRLQIDAYVDETDISSVKLGQTADIVLDAFPKHTFHGKVTKIAAGSTIENGVVTYDVTMSIKQDKRHVLRPDMTASVTIQTGQVTNVLLVPSVAIQMGVHSSTVDVVTKTNGQSTVTSTRVQTGASDGQNTEITKGLTEGETIVEAGAPQGGVHKGPTSPFGPQQRGGGGGGRGGG